MMLHVTLQVVLHSLALEEASACFCVLRCSNYWLRSSTTGLQPVWRELGFVVPMWVQDEHVSCCPPPTLPSLPRLP